MHPILICLSALSLLLQGTQEEREVSVGQVQVRLRTVNAQGQHVGECEIYFVRTGAPLLRPAKRSQPLVFRSDVGGKIFAKLPAGQAWKVFAYKRGLEGVLATRLVDLSAREELRDLVLEESFVRKLDLKGLALWRKSLPSGLGLVIEHGGVLQIRLGLPRDDSQVVELPPMPVGDFSVSLEHETFGTVERIDLCFGDLADPLLRSEPIRGLVEVTLGHPVKVEGTVIGMAEKPLPLATVQMILRRGQGVLSQRPVRSDARGRYRLWFGWKRKGARWPRTPRLLIFAPGHLLRIDSLADLCEEISVKSEKAIDPAVLSGLDLATHRIIRLERASRLHWTVRGRRTSDQFFLMATLPLIRSARAVPPSYLLPITIDSKNRLVLPGDIKVRDSRGQVRDKYRFTKRTRAMDLYLLREGCSQQLYHLWQGDSLPEEKIFDLDRGKVVRVRVRARGKPVSNATIQLFRVRSKKPILSAPRRVSNNGELRIDLGQSESWILVESPHKGQAYRYLECKDGAAEEIEIELEPSRSARILIEHPSPESAVLPLYWSMKTSFHPSIPSPVQYMVAYNEAMRGQRILGKLVEAVEVQVSPWARSVSVRFRQRIGPGPFGAPVIARGSLDLQDPTHRELQLQWR